MLCYCDCRYTNDLQIEGHIREQEFVHFITTTTASAPFEDQIEIPYLQPLTTTASTTVSPLKAWMDRDRRRVEQNLSELDIQLHELIPELDRMINETIKIESYDYFD